MTLKDKIKNLPPLGRVTSADGVKIAFQEYPQPNAVPNSVIIISPGFVRHHRKPVFRQIAFSLNEDFNVICFDFRGHGKSGGFFTFGAKERADLEALLGFAETKYQKIGLLGFSMGAAMTLETTAFNKDRIKTAMVIAPPRAFWEIEKKVFHRRFLSSVWINTITGNVAFPRIGNPFQKREKWIDLVDRISPVPLFLVHGEEDWLILPRHSVELFEKAGEPKKLLLIPKGDHASAINIQFPDYMAKITKEWFSETL